MGIEIWKPIPDYEEYYRVSNLGNVKSLNRITTDGRSVKGKLLTPVKRPDGYMQISRYTEGKQKTELVHRLVAKAFLLGEAPKGYVVDHIDHNRANNSIDNLRYLPKAENDSQGGKVQGKTVAQYNLNGERIKVFSSVAEAYRATNIHDGDITRVCNGKRKSAGGYRWQYE